MPGKGTLRSRTLRARAGAVQQLSQGSNALCADCAQPNPDWASINLGLFICLNCSGIHRSLGTHVSKVRSTTLDQWEPELIALSRELGNEVANNIFEAYCPLSPAGSM